MFERYVALGDSQTEGLNDGDETTGYRGWADRLAEKMAEHNPDFRYANLAVRGKLAGQVRAEQLDVALALKPDVATVIAGVNDLLRKTFDPVAVAADLEAMFKALREQGAVVATTTFPDITKIAPITKRLFPRVLAYNAAVREAAVRQGVLLADSFPVPATTDPRMWSSDRLHASPLGHSRIADAMADTLGMPGADGSWRDAMPPLTPANRRQRARAEAEWARTFLVPWFGRRIRGRSSGDGRTAKRPALEPIESRAEHH